MTSFFGQWKDIVLLALGFLLSIGAAIVGAYIQRRLDRRAERQPLNQLLNFGPDELLFVFPHREQIREAILPRTSTEDFLAMNNVISALINIGWNRKTGVRDTNHVSEADKRRNLVIICSPKSNTFAKEFQDRVRKIVPDIFFFRADEADAWTISNANDGYYRSKSFEQEREYLNAGILRHELPGQSFEDYAIVTKITNPMNHDMKILWIAGIRGIGTWGAGECIKKEWRQIYNKLPEGRKDCNFSALLRVYYNNIDIVSIKVLEVVPLPT